MYNKLKRAFGLTAAILAIVIGSFEVLGGFISFIGGVINLIDALGYMEDYVYLGAAIGTVIGALFDLALGIILIIFGAKLCPKPVKVDGVWQTKKKLHIALIVILGVLVFLSFIGLFLVFAGVGMGGLAILNFLMALVALGFEVTNLFLKDEVGEPVDYTNTPWPTDTVFGDMSAPAETVSVEEAPVVESAPVIEAAPVVEPAPVAAPAPAPVAEAPKAPLSVEEKLAELKRLKELGVLSDEQYNAAVSQLIANLTK